MVDRAAVSKDVGMLLERGLRNLWYPIAPSWKVGRNPLGLTRLGERIVLWRDGEGTVHALEDRCPHRGARLSLGWNLGVRLACWYHGVEVGADGTVLDHVHHVRMSAAQHLRHDCRGDAECVQHRPRALGRVEVATRVVQRVDKR